MKILFLHECVTIIYSLESGFEKLGHESKVFDMRKFPYEEQKQKLIDKIESFKPDYIFIHGAPQALNNLIS